MTKPNVFISSTIYDFVDMRSALKYWLEEAGYAVQLSNHSDFGKDSSLNSYDACLEVIRNCDYFILLIGGRVGGLYDDITSITRKEYQVAYELAKAGRIKRIIIFVRQCVWDAIEDRKGLIKLLSDLDVYENGMIYDKNKIANHESKIIHDAEHIQSFINEVTRKDEFKNDEKPRFNWVNPFYDFSQVIDVLKVEMKLESNISLQIAKQSLKMALTRNLREITRKTDSGRIAADFLGFAEIRSKLIDIRKDCDSIDNIMNGKIELSSKEVYDMGNFLLFFRVGIDEIESHAFEQAVSYGAFLDYNREKMCYESNNVTLALFDIAREIKRLKKFVGDFPFDTHEKMVEQTRGCIRNSDKVYSFELKDMLFLNSIYERLHNIYFLTNYLMRYVLHHDNINDYPVLLHGFVENEKPSEADIMNFYENSE